MNRPITFRAWDKESEWMLPHEAILLVDGEFKVGVWNNDETEIVQEHDFELMQFTGLLDKNGKEIYEGDIVKTERGNCEVYFNHGAFVISYPDRNNWKLLNKGGAMLHEIVGNIYENSELLN